MGRGGGPPPSKGLGSARPYREAAAGALFPLGLLQSLSHILLAIISIYLREFQRKKIQVVAKTKMLVVVVEKKVVESGVVEFKRRLSLWSKRDIRRKRVE
ncbi:hypothetical protein Fmac_026421 [Flemingia macrophylla]|uniref:Uncharacterized protein n=1 Tax=Flemingia macrophylla TaxID=520843 RepID=A0ABD1LEU4_9FABA